MARPKRLGDTKSVTVRLELSLVARLNAVAATLSRPGLTPSLSDVVRMVLLSGLPGVEAAEGLGVRKRKGGRHA
jgi:hypothetical protein